MSTLRSRIGGLLRRSTPGLTATSFFVLAVVLFVFVYPLLSSSSPYTQDVLHPFAGIGSKGHLLGTDELGRDTFIRLIYGLRTELLVCGIGTLLATLIGSTVGIVAGYAGGWLDMGLMRVMDVLLSFPVLVFAMLVVAIYHAGDATVVAICAVVFAPAFARVAYGVVLTLRRSLYVESALVFGATGRQVVAGPLLRGVAPLALAQAFLTLAFSIGLESGLSFLGLGITPPTPSLGLMIADGQQYYLENSAALIVPGVVLVALLVSLGYVADWVRDLIDPGLSRAVPRGFGWRRLAPRDRGSISPLPDNDLITVDDK